MTTTEAAKITTSASKKSLGTAREAWQFIKEDYAQGHQHKKEGKPVAWSCALVEKDIFYSMGVHPYYPEQFAALSAVRRKTPESEKEAVRFARIAEQGGYSADLCGYQRVATGYVMTDDLSDAPLGGMPKPDFVVSTSSVCDCRMKWFEDMAQRLNVPLFTIDRPERNISTITAVPAEHEVAYYMSQVEDLVAFISDVTGVKYDPDRLNETLEWSYKTNDLRQEILELRKAVPSPMGCADGFGTMYPGMYCSGTKKAYEFYKRLR
ncbi:MAG: 2-hydroxyacyl-CoA dehydratase, partial [Candidatus Tectomicrobia bacterium]|nr:2-hydroxyacyl-CoA dehydratase [Candidatus Tectomicrobia bacterium]